MQQAATLDIVPSDAGMLPLSSSPAWFDANWKYLLVPPFGVRAIAARECGPPAALLISHAEQPQLGHVLLQYRPECGVAPYAVMVMCAGRTLWQDRALASHDVPVALQRALDILVGSLVSTQLPAESPTTVTPIDDSASSPLTNENAPPWWDAQWAYPEFEQIWIAGVPDNMGVPPTVVLLHRHRPANKLRITDHSLEPWRRLWAWPDTPLHVQIISDQGTLSEQRAVADRAKLKPIVDAAVQRLRAAVANSELVNRQVVDIGLPAPPLVMPQNDTANRVIDAPEVVGPPQPADLSQASLFPSFDNVADALEPGEEKLAPLGVLAKFVAPTAKDPPHMLLRRLRRCINPVEIEAVEHDCIIVTWYGDRWARLDLNARPYNVRVFFDGQLVAEEDVAAEAEAWRLAQQANQDLAARRRNVAYGPLQVAVNGKNLVLSLDLIEKAKRLFAAGQALRLLHQGCLYELKQGSEPVVISVLQGDSKPIFVHQLNAWIGLIKEPA